MSTGIGIGIGIGGAAMQGTGAGAAWSDPTEPLPDSGLLPHTDHYAGSGELYQDSAKTTPADDDAEAIGASVNQGSDTHDAAQITPSVKPTLKLNIINGEPVFRFDGGDQIAGAFTGALSQPFMVFLVAQLDASLVSNNGDHKFMGGDDSANRMAIGKGGNNNWVVYAGAALEIGACDADWHIWTVLFNGANSRIWLDGVSQAIGNAGAHNPDGITIGAQYGAASYVTGDVARVTIYPGNPPDDDRYLVGQYLATKYGGTYANP